MVSNIEKVFVRLLDEGTNVMRPVAAQKVGGGVFHLLETLGYDPEYETWEFLPGSFVRCEPAVCGEEKILMAVQQVSPIDEI